MENDNNSKGFVSVCAMEQDSKGKDEAESIEELSLSQERGAQGLNNAPLYDAKAIELANEPIFALMDEAVRPTVHSYLKGKGMYTLQMLKNNPLSDEEIKKEYGDNAGSYFDHYTQIVKAFIHTMSLDFKDIQAQAEKKAQLQLVVIKTKVDALHAAIDKKIEGAEIAGKGCFKPKAKLPIKPIQKPVQNKKDPSALEIAKKMQKQSQEKPNQNNPQVAEIRNVLQNHYNAIYKKLPDGNEDAVIASVINRYPNLFTSLTSRKRGIDIQATTQTAQTIVNDINVGKDVVQSLANTSGNVSTTEVQTINNTVETVGQDLIASSPVLQTAYGVYKMVMLILDGLGLNSSTVEAVALQEEQVLLQDMAQDLETAKSKIETELQVLQTKYCVKKAN
jgi:hypothetical protein